MAIRRSLNLVNQQRIDTPHLRSIESAVRNDFDELLESFVLGEDGSYVLRGLEISMVGAVGSSATGLQLMVENSSIFHGKSLAAGTFLVIPTGTPNEILNSNVNVKVEGSFTPNALNYIGLELKREIDDTTLSQAYLWNPTTNTEITKTLPLAQVLHYEIVISSSVFASNILPLAIVETDVSNNVTSIIDQRPMLFRLGTAGDLGPNPNYNYPWNHHVEGRNENHWRSSSAVSPFRGGDKQLLSMKEWMDAVMTEIKLIKGTPRWYDLTSNLSIDDLFADLANLQMTGRGGFFHSADFAGQINWDRDFYLRIIGTRLQYRVLANLNSNHISLSDGEVAYIDLLRDALVDPNLIFVNGGSIVDSVGEVPWTDNVLSGDFIKLSSATKDKYYRIQSVLDDHRVTLSTNYEGVSTGSAGDKASYTWGSYETSASPTTKRHIKVAQREDVPFDGSAYWLFFRDDNGSSMAKVYIRTGGGPGELEQGESVQIADNTSKAVLEYVGSRGEADRSPNYSGSIDTQEVTRVEFDDQDKIAPGQYWLIESASGVQYYVWYSFFGVGVDPLIAGRMGIQVDLSVAGDTGQIIAQKSAAAIDLIADFSATFNYNVLTVQDEHNGTPTDAINGTMGGAFYITVPTEGDVSTKFNQQNYNTVDGENLTRRSARLTAMVADKAQDKTLGFNPDYKVCIKSTNGINQEIYFANSNESGSATVPFLNVILPSSADNGIIELVGGPVVLGVNQVAYYEIDRNDTFYYTLASLTIVNIPACPLNENIFVFAYRLNDTTVWLWDGSELINGDNPSQSAISEMVAANAYDEPLDVVAGAPGSDYEITGPVVSGTVITLPPDSRDAGSVQAYIVGKGVLDISLNGQLLRLGADFEEVGGVGSASGEFRILQDLVISDRLDIRIKTFGGYTGAGVVSTGEANTGANVGTGSEVFKFKSGIDLVFRTLRGGANVSLSQGADEITINVTGSTGLVVEHIVEASYVVLDTDGYNVLLVTTGNTTRTITLPTAADNVGRQLVIKKVDVGTGNLRARAEGTEAIDDQVGASYLVGTNEIENQWDSLTFVCDGSNWFVI